ncbi:hypothetical protein [Pseudomonas sp.]|uniref:hypothetical protein n=1 Tax=Pseudomonas sp. TaxID=306 RepID=UPI003D0F7E2E
MNIKGALGTLFIAPLLLTLTGCLAQNTQTQGLQNGQAANDPCAPSATSSLIATGRNLLQIGSSLVETQHSINGSGASYDQRVQVAENAQRVDQGNNVLNSVERLAGNVNGPCPSPTTADATTP